MKIEFGKIYKMRGYPVICKVSIFRMQDKYPVNSVIISNSSSFPKNDSIQHCLDGRFYTNRVDNLDLVQEAIILNMDYL